jgi:acyl-CoA synthetase (AMP-forming)/AMP-acid ligase II
MAVDDRARQLTFAQLANVAGSVAAGLLAAGIEPGMIVSWQLPTVLESVVLYAALSRLSVVQNPVIPILRDAEVGHIVRELGSDVLITPAVWRGFDYSAMAERVRLTTGVSTMVVDHTFAGPGDLALPRGDQATLPSLPRADADVDDKARWVFYSSGTTAAPKGARHSDRSITAGSNGLVAIDNVGLVEGDVVPIPYPITHVGGHCTLSAALRTGCRVILIEVFDAQRSPLVMAQHGATTLGSAPPFFHAYLAAQRAHGSIPLFPDLRMGMSGGAPSPPELHQEVKRDLGGAGIVSGWGLTEFPIATEASPTDPDRAIAETVGRPAPGVTIRVVDQRGIDIGSGSEGELRLDGPQKLLGYVDSQLDSQAFDEQGFFRTGDLGVIDGEGRVTVTGRIKDIIIRNAENISAVQVENVLYLHPDIADVAVVGIPDTRTGERACAAVVLAPGAPGLTLLALGEHCRAQGLAPQRIPERIDIFEALPRNAMGKLLKQDIRAMVLSKAAQDS